MIEDIVYLKFGFVPTLTTRVRCDNCNAILNAGPNYQPKFCPECGEKAPDLSSVNWKDEKVPYVQYIEYLFETEPDYIIMKYKDWPDFSNSPVPCIMGKDITDCINKIYDLNTSPLGGPANMKDIHEDDLIMATKAEMLEYAKHCGMHAGFSV